MNILQGLANFLLFCYTPAVWHCSASLLCCTDLSCRIMVLNAQSGSSNWQLAPKMHCRYSKCIKCIWLSSADAAVPASTVHCTNACVWALTCLQEIRCCCSGRDDSFRVGHCSEQFGLSRVSVFEDHDGGYVATAVAVVGSWPHSYQLLIEHELVALMDELMSPADQLQVVDVDELQFF